MNGQKRFEKLCFINECNVKCTYESKQSAYYTVLYKNESIRFCVSDHHNKNRGNMITVISKSRKINKIKEIAFDIREKLNLSLTKERR
tara:strand:+ start:911 stop:1174 length:264 start_codon:yes stop_codon:yes gene_type:complete